MSNTDTQRERSRAQRAEEKRLRDTGAFRVCNVRYLNSVVFRSLQTIDWLSYEECLPSECARRLHEGEADLACIPLAEFAQHGAYDLLPFGIVSTGTVDSVVLFSENPLSELSEIYIDEASQTSVVLLRLLLGSQLEGKEISFWRVSAAEALQSARGDAGALVIGNQAYHSRGKFAHELDLSQEWYEQTGLPFVFAVWALRRGALSDEKREELISVLGEGVQNAQFFARQWADEEKTDREQAVSYIMESVTHALDDEAIRGARAFLGKAAEAGSLPLPSGIFSEEPSQKTAGGRSLDSILSDAAYGKRISISEGLRIASEASLGDLCLASDERRQRLHSEDSVSYIVDRNINYTNVCNVYCRFCAFYEAPGRSGGYVLSKDEIGKKIEEMLEAGGIQILLQGGLHPELGIEYYEDLFRWIKERYPINLHALSADEIWHIARVSNLSIEAVLRRLIAVGLGSLPGGGAEILIDGVRRKIARLKTTTPEWLEVHRTAHRLGITSTATMMFGVGESWLDRCNHIHKLRLLQDETGGFTAFITWPYQESKGATNLKRGDTSAQEYLRMQAVSRLLFDNVANIQSSWVTMGSGIGQLGLFFGANDFGSVMFEENVVSSAGTTFQMNASDIEHYIRAAGFEPFRRDVHYNQVPG